MGNFFQISSSSISSLLGYIGVVFNNYEPILIVVLGLAVGVWIFALLIKWFVPYTTTITSGEAKGEHIRASRYERQEYDISDDDDEDFDEEDL